MVHIASEMVEVLRLTPEQSETVATYRKGQTVASLTFPGLTVPVDDIFDL